MLDAERGRKYDYAPDDTCDTAGEVGPPSLAGGSEGDVEDCPDGSTPAGGQGPSSCDSAAPGPRCSMRNTARKVTWWEKEPKAYSACGAKSAAESRFDLHKPEANGKGARAHFDLPRRKHAIKEKVAAHEKLSTWSKILVNNKNHKAIKTRVVFDIKHDAEGKMTRYKARLVAQGCNQVPGRDFDETWAPVLSAATIWALLAVAAAPGWEVHNVNVQTASSTPRWTRRCTSNSLTVSSRRA